MKRTIKNPLPIFTILTLFSIASIGFANSDNVDYKNNNNYKNIYQLFQSNHVKKNNKSTETVGSKLVIIKDKFEKLETAINNLKIYHGESYRSTSRERNSANDDGNNSDKSIDSHNVSGQYQGVHDDCQSLTVNWAKISADGKKKFDVELWKEVYSQIKFDNDTYAHKYLKNKLDEYHDKLNKITEEICKTDNSKNNQPPPYCNDGIKANFNEIESQYTDIKNLADDITTHYTETFNQFKEKTDIIMECATLATIMVNVDYSDDENNKQQKDTSMDGKIICKSKGHPTQDFDSCKQLIITYNTLMGAEKAGTDIQKRDLQLKSSEEAAKVIKNESSDYTASLNAQKNVTENQADAHRVQSSFQGAKFTTLLALYNKMPDHEDIINDCISNSSDEKKLNKLFDDLNNVFGTEPEKARRNHCEYLTYSKTKGIIMNAGAKAQARQAMMDAGVSAAKFLGMGMMLDKQASSLKDLIDGVNDFTGTEVDLSYEPNDLSIDQCAIYPATPGCEQYRINGTSGFNQPGLAMLGGGQNGTYEYLNDDDDGNNSSSNGEKSINGSPDGIGSIVSDSKSSNEFESPSPGITGKKARSPAAGTPGGGGGKVSAPGVGNASPPNEKSASNQENVYKPKHSYKSGSSVSFSNGTNKNSGKNDKNPFKDMFKKTKGKIGNILNFRDIASSVTGLFQRLSKRYQAIDKRDALIKYAIKKNKK